MCLTRPLLHTPAQALVLVSSGHYIEHLHQENDESKTMRIQAHGTPKVAQHRGRILWENMHRIVPRVYRSEQNQHLGPWKRVELLLDWRGCIDSPLRAWSYPEFRKIAKDRQTHVEELALTFAVASHSPGSRIQSGIWRWDSIADREVLDRNKRWYRSVLNRENTTNCTLIHQKYPAVEATGSSVRCVIGAMHDTYWK